MADIAFMLLIFFLVTTTMSVDMGINRKLPPPVPPDAKPPKVKERNVLVVLINKDNKLAIEGDPADVSTLRDRVKEFFLNPNNDPNLSETFYISDLLKEEMNKPKPDQDKIRKYRDILDEIGDVKKSKGVVSLQNDRGTLYGKYIEVQNEIVGAINDLRNQLAKDTWGKPYDDLTKEQQKLIREIYPFSISEAEPRSIKTK